MSALDTITKLRHITVANGATEAEETNAATKIGRMLMQRTEISIGAGPTISQEGTQRSRATYG